MAIVVMSIQFFPMPDKTYVIKEVAMVDVVSNMEKLLIAKPPCNINVFSARHRKTLRYVVDKVHGIPWNVGYMDLEDVEEQVRKTVDEADLIYIKGLDRVNFLLNLTGVPVHKIIDLNEIQNIGKTTERNYSLQCQYSHPRHNNLRCALEQAIRYRDFMRENYYYRI